jgi:peptidoglycan/xylan/chitin deacetylase (PgdA/CDA1 family)
MHPHRLRGGIHAVDGRARAGLWSASRRLSPRGLFLRVAPQRAATSAQEAAQPFSLRCRRHGLFSRDAARHDAGMPDPVLHAATPLHRPPRHAQAWPWAVVLSQALVAVAWWRLGWQSGLPLLLASHALLLWGVFWPQSRLYGPALSRLPTRERLAWLTIDDGPSADTAAVLDLLDAHAAKATFFVVGERAQARPDAVREIVRRGHTLGNHSATHPAAWFWALGPRRMAAEIERTQAILRDITGAAPRWFRAVVGMANPFVSAPLQRLGLARVAWSARGFDAVTADPQVVVARIERTLAPGAIVLAHEGAAHGRNVEGIALLLQRLDALGYRCVLPETLETEAVACRAPELS